MQISGTPEIQCGSESYTNDRSHAPRGNASRDAPRSLLQKQTQSVHGGIPTRSVGTIITLDQRRP
jgi:hypothetical protein